MVIPEDHLLIFTANVNVSLSVIHICLAGHKPVMSQQDFFLQAWYLKQAGVGRQVPNHCVHYDSSG